MKKIFCISVLAILFLTCTDGFSQKKKKVKSKPSHAAITAPVMGTSNLADTVILPLKFNIREMGFGAQGTGIIACQYLTIDNTTLENIQITDIYTTLPKEFTIPSPARSMFPVNIQPKRKLTISICFTPDKVGEFKGNLVVKTKTDSTVIPTWGKGIHPEDVSKLPKTSIAVTSVKKGKEASIEMILSSQSKVVLQIMDAVGNLVRAYFSNELMNPGNYQQLFDCTEKGGKKLAPGTFYARFIATEVNTSREYKMTKMFTIK